MKKIILKPENYNKIDEFVACIGSFDGFHRGHLELVERTLEIAKNNNIKSALITFDPEPQQLFNKSFTRIMSLNEKQELCDVLGFDYFIVIKFNKNTKDISSEDFIKKILNKTKINTLVCGFDYTFGKEGKGNPKLLKKIGNFKTVVIEEKQLYRKKISTSRIKNEYSKGNFVLINKLLGRELILKLNVINSTKINNKYLLECLPSDSKFMKINNGDYVDFKVKDGHYYFKAPYEIDNGSLLIYVFNN